MKVFVLYSSWQEWFHKKLEALEHQNKNIDFMKQLAFELECSYNTVYRWRYIPNMLANRVPSLRKEVFRLLKEYETKWQGLEDDI